MALHFLRLSLRSRVGNLRCGKYDGRTHLRARIGRNGRRGSICWRNQHAIRNDNAEEETAIYCLHRSFLGNWRCDRAIEPPFLRPIMGKKGLALTKDIVPLSEAHSLIVPQPGSGHFSKLMINARLLYIHEKKNNEEADFVSKKSINLVVATVCAPTYFLLLPSHDPRPGVSQKSRWAEIDYGMSSPY